MSMYHDSDMNTSGETQAENKFWNELDWGPEPRSLQATGVNTNGMAKSVGVTAPIYPMRGNVVTVPTNVSCHKRV